MSKFEVSIGMRNLKAEDRELVSSLEAEFNVPGVLGQAGMRGMKLV